MPSPSNARVKIKNLNSQELRGHAELQRANTALPLPAAGAEPASAPIIAPASMPISTFVMGNSAPRILHLKNKKKLMLNEKGIGIPALTVPK